MTRGPGQWNAFVEAGTTREQRVQRLAEVPERWRARVEAHVRTAFLGRRKRAGKSRNR